METVILNELEFFNTAAFYCYQELGWPPKSQTTKGQKDKRKREKMSTWTRKKETTDKRKKEKRKKIPKRHKHKRTKGLLWKKGKNKRTKQNEILQKMRWEWIYCTGQLQYHWSVGLQIFFIFIFFTNIY